MIEVESITKTKEDILMIRKTSMDTDWRYERLLFQDRRTIWLTPASCERVHSRHWMSQVDGRDNWLGGGTRRGMWSHSEPQAGKVDRGRRLWCCGRPSSLREGDHWSYLHPWWGGCLWGRGTQWVEAQPFLCRPLNYLLLSWDLIRCWIGVLVGGWALLWGAEEIVGEIHRLQDLEERGHGYGCTAHAGDDRVEGGAPLLDRNVEVDGEGGILYCWWDEEWGVSSRHINQSREDNWLRNIILSGAEGRKEVMHEIQDLVWCRSGLDGGILPSGCHIAGCNPVFYEG